MDTSKFEITLDHKEFYNSYINTIRRLYSESFIQKNNIMPDNEQSLTKTMLTAMGETFDKYDAESFEKIIKKTNERYDKIKGSDIVKNVREKVLRNITIFADIISSIMKEIGMYDLSEKFNCTSKKLLEENVTGNDLDEHINDTVKSTESGIDELNGILDQISDSKNEPIIAEENVIGSAEEEENEEDIERKKTLDDKADEIFRDVKENVNKTFKEFRESFSNYEKFLYAIINNNNRKIVSLESENANLKKQLDEAMEQAVSVPTDPEKRIELIKELISSHKDKAELKEILISFIVNL